MTFGPLATDGAIMTEAFLLSVFVGGVSFGLLMAFVWSICRDMFSVIDEERN